MSKKQGNWSLTDSTARATVDSRRAVGSTGSGRNTQADKKPSQRNGVQTAQVVKQLSSSIASGCGIKGELFFTGIAEINCRVEGQIASEGEFIVGESAQVFGDIRAERALIFGSVTGDIVCSERLELHAGARVVGSICSPRLVMHDGVRFEGECAMPSRVEQHETKAGVDSAESQQSQIVNE